MAQVTILIDTKTDDMTLTIDGQPVADICCVNIYKYRNEISLGIEVSEKMGGDMVKRSYISKNQEIDDKIKIIPVIAAKSGLEDVMKHFVMGNKK